MYCEYLLEGTCQIDLNTEIRFNVAEARQDGCEIIKLYFPLGEDERDNLRITHCMIKVLRSVMHGGAIEYFIEDKNVGNGTVESEFMLNKYGKYMTSCTDGFKSFYIKV